MKWKIQHKGPETIETKVCLAFKLDTSNYHMDQIETQLHSRIQNFICSIPICPRFESTKVAQIFDSRAFKISNHILATIFLLSIHNYLSQFISSIPILSLWNRSIRATKYEKTTGTNETKTILWPAMNRYRKQRWISFDNDRIWIVRRASFIRNMGHSCFAIISRKIDGLSPSHTVMMEWRARTRARTLVASHLTIVELHLREQVNA